MAKKKPTGPDLSNVVSGKIAVHIQGKGVRYANLGRPARLHCYADQADTMITGKKDKPADPINSRWQLISFDEQKRILVVREVERKPSL